MKVKYVGLSDERVIGAADWASIGVTHDGVQWDASNGFTVDISDEAANWLLPHDREFRSVDEPVKTAAKQDKKEA